jgi:hypothetical protein
MLMTLSRPPFGEAYSFLAVQPSSRGNHLLEAGDETANATDNRGAALAEGEGLGQPSEADQGL